MTDSIDLAWPFTGRWQARNSPADRVPSHGTNRFGSTYAIDFVPVDAHGRSAPFHLGALLRPEPPERFVGFGRPVLAPLDGVVVAVIDGQPDHATHRGLPSIGYSLTQRQRAAGGWAALAGNVVMLEAGGAVVALCHLQRGSTGVRVGQRVTVGEPIGRCGNSGNSTEPHVHLQVMDRAEVDRARAVRVSFGGTVPRNGEVVEAASVS